MTLTRLHVSAFLGLAVATWAAILLLQGADVGAKLLAPFGAVVSVLMVFALSVEHCLWRVTWLHPWFFTRPDVRGLWRVDLHSNWIDPVTGLKKPPIVAYMGVTQTFSKLQMHLMTPESESRLESQCIQGATREVGFQIVGVYTNIPGMFLRQAGTSAMHRGAFALETHGPDSLRPIAIAGEYWTDRPTTGTMELTDRIEDVHTRYADSVLAFRARDAAAAKAVVGND